MADTHGIRGTPELIPVADLKPNPWNYNTQSDKTFSKLAASIRRHGFARPLLVRTHTDGTKEIIDGEHGWRAAKLLGMTAVPCINLGSVSDARAREMTIVLNELGGAPDEARLADLVREISGYADAAEALQPLPYSAAELNMLTSKIDFSFSSTPKVDPRPAPSPEEKASPMLRVRVDFEGNEALEIEELLSEAGDNREAFVLEALRGMADVGA
jgi:hypothetical protein